MDDVFMVRDDVSRCGLRRLHLVRARGQVERDQVLEQWVGPGQVEGMLEYQDEADMWHLRLYWREGDNG